MFARIVGFFGIIIMEIFVFSLIIAGLENAGLHGVASVLTIVFIIWLIADIVLKIVVRGGKSLISRIWNY